MYQDRSERLPFKFYSSSLEMNRSIQVNDAIIFLKSKHSVFLFCMKSFAALPSGRRARSAFNNGLALGEGGGQIKGN